MTGRPRALVVHSSDELYGADRMLLHVIAAFRDLDVDLDVLLPSDIAHGPFPLCEVLTSEGVAWRHADLPILRRAAVRPLGVLRLVRSSIRTGRSIRRGRYDLVYLSSSACLVVAPIARVMGVRRSVLHLQERWDGRSAHVLRWLARWTSARVAISEYVAGTTRLAEPAPVVVENAVDDASRRAVVDVPRVRAGLEFVVASRWNRWKGHRTLLDAWGRAGCPGTLVVLGGPPSSGEAVDVPALVAELPIPDSVRLVGEVADIAPHLASADVLVLPSDEPEPFGLVVIEAFSLGRPVIASRAGGPVEIVQDGVTGWFFHPQDADDLARVLTSLDLDAVRQAGRSARADYEARFEPARFRAELGAVLRAELSAS